MGPDLEKPKAATGVLTGKEDTTVTHNEEDNIVQCMSNYEDNYFHEEAANLNDDRAKVPAEIKDVEVDIVGCTKSNENVQVEDATYEDCTESMSSFGDTLSENENVSSQKDDMEVDSRFSFDDPSWAAFDDFGGELPLPVRRKKLTDHWRRFIRPLTWRCKWLELRIKEFQSQAQKYDKQLAEYSNRKLFDFVDGLETKSLPFSSCTQRKKLMKRKKRKRVEETADMTSYMLQHNLFSYYECKKSAASRVWVNDDCSNLDKAVNATYEFGLQEELPSFDFKSDGNVHESSLQKIELLQFQVRKLKARIEKVERENPGKFWLSMPETDDMLTNSDQDPESRDQTNVNSKTTGDALLESAVSSHGEAIPVLDLIESTSQAQVGDLGENTKEGVLKDERAVKEEESQLAEKPEQVVEKPTSEGEMPTETAAARVNFGGKTLPKRSSNIITYSKRNRARRKSAKGGLNRKK